MLNVYQLDFRINKDKIILTHKNSGVADFYWASTIKFMKMPQVVLNNTLGATDYHTLHQLNKISTEPLLMKRAEQLRIQFPIALFQDTQQYPCIHTQGMTGYLPTSDKSRPRSILGARTRISGIVSISSAHTQGLQGRQWQATHQHYPHQSSTTCTLSMQPGWNTAILAFL